MNSFNSRSVAYGNSGLGSVTKEPIVVGSSSTVVAEFNEKPRRGQGHQTEAELEAEFVNDLVAQGYEKVQLSTQREMLANVRTQLELLNDVTFTDSDWRAFSNAFIVNPNESVADKTRRIQLEERVSFTFNDGITRNVSFIDKKNIHRNAMQVLTQHEVTGARLNRYDVTILVNGFPLVHVELKRRGIKLQEAFNQIERYQRDSFWAELGLYKFVQLFVISNGTLTKYYSNTTRELAVEDSRSASRRKTKESGKSFDFTSYWADANNKRITDLGGFTRTFLSKRTILNVLTKYCVFTSGEKLLVMRPYQIVATERILARINLARTYNWHGSVKAGGFIWHTTGSGKTLTSFKAAQLASAIDGVNKVLFVVDRKDLDYQTIVEYESFQKGCVSSNTSVRQLRTQMEDADSPIVVTTIQKLNNLVSSSENLEAYSKDVVIIFDEAHRSQFGLMHKVITDRFKKHFLFGFTGTPIFTENAASSSGPSLTTEQVFGDRLHTYTVVDGIEDGNVLPFKVEFVKTVGYVDDVSRPDSQVRALNTREVLHAPARIANIVSHVIETFDRKTGRQNITSPEKKRTLGFNSLLAVDSIDAAKKYYLEFKKQQEETDEKSRLRVGIIYSFNPNEEVSGLGDESFDTKGLDTGSRDFLDNAITDYNKTFSTNFSIDKTNGFENYYKDVAKRLRGRDLDVVIVVNMFLTGFDAPGLNTLWVDKNLRYHGLIQAFSRTNRVLDATKPYGVIVSFRNLDEEVEKAVTLYGDRDASSVSIIAPFSELYAEYETTSNKLLESYPPGETLVTGEAAKRAFVTLFGTFLRQKTQLEAFDDFVGKEIIDVSTVADYQSLYLDLYEASQDSATDAESVIDEVSFEIELVKRVDVNVDYILSRVAAYRAALARGEEGFNERKAIERAISSNPHLRSKKALIRKFIEQASFHTTDMGLLRAEWERFVESELLNRIDSLADSEGIEDKGALTEIIANSLDKGDFHEGGEVIVSIMPRVSRFAKTETGESLYVVKKRDITEAIRAMHEEFLDIF